MTEADIEAIRSAAADGVPNRKIAVAIGRDQKTVNNAVRKLVEAGKLEPRDPRVSAALREAIRQNAHRTVGHRALADELGCTVWQVRAIRKEFTSDAKARARKAYRLDLKLREAGENQAPADKLGAALSCRRPYQDVPLAAILNEDSAWSAGRKVPSLRERARAAA
jgi:predicted transcriptional regulator